MAGNTEFTVQDLKVLEALGKCKSEECAKEAQSHVALLGITINVFFDGTENNIFNAKKRPGEKSSYGNDKSNVGLMIENLPGANVKVYLEGIGTKKDQKDSDPGKASGTGDYGIDARVREAFKAVVEKSDFKLKGEKPQYVTFNVFGFSRGAAAARNFVHLVNTQPELFKGWNFGKGIAKKNRGISVNFVGLFDTVASYGTWFYNDTSDLHLNFEAGYASKVVHLVALDEYRANFSLTNINSALSLPSRNGKGKMGYELRIPGAHSDVGGGYLSSTEQRDLGDIDNYGASHRDFIFNKGWYTQSQRVGSSVVYRRAINVQFHKVALAIMLDKARLYAHLNVPEGIVQINGADAVSQTIRNIQGILRKWAKDESHTIWDLDGNSDQAWARWVRNTAIHYSVNQDTGTDMAAYRMTINREKNQPKREEHDG